MTEENRHEELSMFKLELDAMGMPILTISEPGWISSLSSAVGYSIRRLFRSKSEKEHEDNVVSQFVDYLRRIKLGVSFDPLTGSPVMNLYVEETKAASELGLRGKHRKKHKCRETRNKLRKASKRIKKRHGISISGNENVTASPIVVKSEHGNITYQIQNLVVNINAEVVTQINTNPEQVINVIQDKLREGISKLNLPIDK